MLKEACVENFTNVPGVIERGAKRIELCDNLAVGGTTPSIGVIKITAEYCSDKDASRHRDTATTRRRFRLFSYGKSHHDAGFRRNNFLACQWYSGRSFNRSQRLDKPFLEEIAKLAIANGTELVFHMAFDQIPEDKQRDALLWLREIGFTRILTHGGPTENTIFDNAAHIADLAKISPDMTIMPGGGITKDNLADLEKVLEFNEVHGTRIV
jgi:copper homeostasis protein